MSENQIHVCPILVRSWVSVGLQVAMTTCTNPKLQVAHELEYRVVRSAGTADGVESHTRSHELEYRVVRSAGTADVETELRAPEEKLVELSSRTLG